MRNMTTRPPGRNQVSAVTVLNERGTSPYLLVCEHASNYIPASYNGLGLTGADLERHIAWDPGAADLAQRLSEFLDAPLVLSEYSRLLIDCNRPLGSPGSIPVRSEDTDIPGNHALSTREKDQRAASFFSPFQERITEILEQRIASVRPTLILGIHTFSPTYCGAPRIWHVGVLYRRAHVLASRLIEGFSCDPDLVVGDNEPYRIEPTEDYTVPVHGDARGLPALLIEVRNDLISTTETLEAWTVRITKALDACEYPT